MRRMSFGGGELGMESDKEASPGIVGAEVPVQIVVAQLQIDQPPPIPKLLSWDGNRQPLETTVLR